MRLDPYRFFVGMAAPASSEDVLTFWYGDGYEISYRAKWFPSDGMALPIASIMSCGHRISLCDTRPWSILLQDHKDRQMLMS